MVEGGRVEVVSKWASDRRGGWCGGTGVEE